MDQRFDAARLRAFADDVLARAGLPAEPAEAVARGLVEGDLYGHITHGLALLADYVEEIEHRHHDDGRPAGGPCRCGRGRDMGCTPPARRLDDDARSRRGGPPGGRIRPGRGRHPPQPPHCLPRRLSRSAGARRQPDPGLLLRPGAAHVAPYGGLAPVITPDPIAAGFPAEPDPILIDVVDVDHYGWHGGPHARHGGRLPGQWLLDREGSRPTTPGR